MTHCGPTFPARVLHRCTNIDGRGSGACYALNAIHDFLRFQIDHSYLDRTTGVHFGRHGAIAWPRSGPES